MRTQRPGIFIPNVVDRANCPNFTIGSLEDEARRIAREICAADVAA